MRYTEDQLKEMAKPASDSEEQRMDNATRMVKDALANNGVIYSWNYEVFAQGSYANNTNIRNNSDIDINVCYTGAFYFDLLYVKFPDMYNSNQGSFGRISAVKNGVKSKPLFGTINESIDYTYPDGYIYPLLGGVVGLMKYDEVTDTLRWIINPMSETFNLENLPLVKYVGWLKKDLDPQRNGKNQLMYMEAEEAYEAYAKKNKYSILIVQI